jgi:hypothetical protein
MHGGGGLATIFLHMEKNIFPGLRLRAAPHGMETI